MRLGNGSHPSQPCRRALWLTAVSPEAERNVRAGLSDDVLGLMG
jgi:hypothetical protein